MSRKECWDGLRGFGIVFRGMIKRILLITLTVLMLSGCAGESAAPTASYSIGRLSPALSGLYEAATPALSPTPTRHPGDPVLKYPEPLTGRTYPLTSDVADAIFYRGLGYYEGDPYGKESGLAYSRNAFKPKELTDCFEAGKLHMASSVLSHLTEIEWPWDESELLGDRTDTVFLQVWRQEIPLVPEPIILHAVGLYLVDSEDFADKELTRENLYDEEGVLYFIVEYADGDCRLLHRVSDFDWRVRTEIQLAINESNSCAWLVEIPPPGTGTGYEDTGAIWRNLVVGGIDLQYTISSFDIRPFVRVDQEKEDSDKVQETWISAAVLYGLRYDWLPDGTRVIRAPDRLKMHIEEGYSKEFWTFEDDFIEEKEYRALLTFEYMCEGNRYHMILKKVEGVDQLDVTGYYYPKSGMPSCGYYA